MSNCLEPGRKSKQRDREIEGGVREMLAADREARCEITSHKPHGKI